MAKKKCNGCDILKNLTDEKGAQCQYVDMLEMPHITDFFFFDREYSANIGTVSTHIGTSMCWRCRITLTFLKMYCSSYPMVLSVDYFRTFNETLEHFIKT